MDILCSRCNLDKPKVFKDLISDDNFEYKFSDIKRIEKTREYYLCQKCSIILDNYYNRYKELTKILLYIFWVASIIFLAVAIYYLYTAKILLYLALGIAWFFLNTLVVPFSPLVRKKYYTSGWKLSKLVYENRRFSQEIYDSASDKQKKIIRLKEFDVIYNADLITTNYAEERMLEL